ncbi:hypothetical protein D9M70_479460 [compost metagenome]
MPQGQQDEAGQWEAAQQAELDGELDIVVVRMVEMNADVFARVLGEHRFEAAGALANYRAFPQKLQGVAEHIVANFVGLLDHFAIHHHIVQAGSEHAVLEPFQAEILADHQDVDEDDAGQNQAVAQAVLLFQQDEQAAHQQQTGEECGVAHARVGHDQRDDHDNQRQAQAGLGAQQQLHQIDPAEGATIAQSQ